MDKATFFRGLLRDAYLLARHAMDYCYTDPETGIKEDKITALSYAAACTAKYSAAAAIYWCSPELEDDDVPELLAKFDQFTKEIRNDYATDHSRQWVEIKFSEMYEIFSNSAYRLDNADSN